MGKPGQAWPLQATGRKHMELWEDPISDLEWIRSVNLRDRGYIQADELHDIWFKLIGSYSPLKMTYSSDKLVALSGVAEVVYGAQDFCHGYLAGLWRETLIQDMLWFVTTAHEPRPSEFRAPSWSWASVEGLIGNAENGMATSFGFTGAKAVARLVDYQISTHPEDVKQTGRILGSFLKMQGVIKPAPALESGDNENVYKIHDVILFGEDIRGDVYIDALSETRSILYLMPLKLTVDKEFRAIATADSPCTVKGLLLQKDGDCYNRVGMFSVSKLSMDYFDDCKRQDILFIDGDRKSTHDQAVRS
jgi:hypothetical protein